jgi:hypothetical protein
MCAGQGASLAGTFYDSFQGGGLPFHHLMADVTPNHAKPAPNSRLCQTYSPAANAFATHIAALTPKMIAPVRFQEDRCRAVGVIRRF